MTLDEAAVKLISEIQSKVYNNHITGGVGNDIIYVYSQKRISNGIVPKTYEGYEVKMRVIGKIRPASLRN